MDNWRYVVYTVCAAVIVVCAASLAKAQDRPWRAIPQHMQQVDRTLTLAPGALVASSATVARHVEAVRLACSATCFAMVSASNGSTMANFISGAYIPANASVIWRASGGEYVIGIGPAGTLYIQELTR